MRRSRWFPSATHPDNPSPFVPSRSERRYNQIDDLGSDMAEVFELIVLTMRSSRVPGAVRFYLAFAAIVLILVAFEAFLTSLPFADAIPDYAEQLQQRQLDSYFEMIQLLITLATVTIGGITGYVIKGDHTKGLSSPQLRRVVASWALCAASLYFGYLAYQQAVWMLNNSFFNPANPRIWIPTRAQFWSFLASVVVFADFVYMSLQVTDAPAKESS